MENPEQVPSEVILETLSLQEQVRLLVEENKKLREQNGILDEANKELIAQGEDLSKKAYYDPLTGLKTRLVFNEEVADYFNNRKEYSPEKRHETAENNEGFVLVLFDVDYFKKVNDTFGHATGDLVLQMVSKTIKSYVRESDLVARWGGEEIAVIFKGSTSEGAELKTNFIREKIKEINFEEYPYLKITISAGLANSVDFDSQSDLFEAVDGALYQSKNTGRDKVTSFSTASVS